MEITIGMLVVIAMVVMLTPVLVWMLIGYRRELKKEKLSQERA